MKILPSHILTDLDSVKQLNTIKDEAFLNRDFSAVKTFDSIRQAFESYHISLMNNQSIDKDLVSKNDFLRLLVDNFSLGRKNIRFLHNSSELKTADLPTENAFLYQMSIDIFSKNIDLKSDLLLKSFPKDWDRYFKIPKTNYTIGGVASDFTSWKNLNLDKLPVNCIYIVDPYLFKDRKLAELNLTEILKGLIGDRNDVKEFELAIFVKMDRNDPSFSKTKVENFRTVTELISGLYPKKTFKPAILYIPESKMHDRYLFTNFYYLNSGKGFNIYNDRKKLEQQKSSNLDINILSEPNTFKSYLNKLSEVYHWIKNSTQSLEYSGSLPTNLFAVFEQDK